LIVYRLARAAQADVVDLLAWTEENFGEIARLRHERLPVTVLRDVAAEPERINSIARPELGENVRSHHLRHSPGARAHRARLSSSAPAI